MDFEENVDTEVNEAAADEDFSEELTEEEEESSESLDSLMDGEEGGEEQAEEPEPEQKGTAEPGYVQRRIEKAVARALAAERENIRNEYEAQFAPLRERLLEMDAQELVRKGTVKDLETAKELVRYRQGQSQAQRAEAPEQPRQSNGQFAPKDDPVMQTKVNMLAAQADKIRERTGLDVISEFSNNEEIRKAVVNGEMDFYDVAEQMKNSSIQRRKPPAPTRSSNGASGQTPNAIENMSDEQFARMERKIAEGARFTLR